MTKTLKTFLGAVLMAIVILFALQRHSSAENQIIARVGDDIITSNDLERRYTAHLRTNDGQHSEHETKAIKLQLIHSLINEKVIIQGARKLKISVTEAEIKEEVASIEASQNLEEGAFFKQHEQYGIEEKELKEQIYVKLAWQKILHGVIFPKYGQDSVSDSELNEYMVQNHPGSIRIKGFIYKFDQDNLGKLKKLYKLDKGNLCDKNTLENVTGLKAEALNASLSDIKSRNIQQVASFANETSGIITSERDGKTVALILCEKKPVESEAELDKIKMELRNKRIAPYAEHYFKGLKKDKTIVINDIQ